MQKPLITSSIILFAAGVLLAVWTTPYAQLPPYSQRNVVTSVDRSFDPAPKDCADVRWSEATLRVFPSIGSACQAVEQRNGKTYVKLEGTVEDVENEGRRVRVNFEDGGELTFRPTPRTRLYIDGKRTQFADLEDGTRLNFYIPEDRLQAELQPDPQRFAFIIFPFDVTTTAPSEQSAAAMQSGRDDQRQSMAMNEGQLPRTAGPLPLIGLGGAVLVLVGAAATLRRKMRKSSMRRSNN